MGFSNNSAAVFGREVERGKAVIVRDITTNPELLEHFDWFNDYKDTCRFLESRHPDFLPSFYEAYEKAGAVWGPSDKRTIPGWNHVGPEHPQTKAALSGAPPAELRNFVGTRIEKPEVRPTPITDALRKETGYEGVPASYLHYELFEDLERQLAEAREQIEEKDQSIALATRTIMINNELMTLATEKLAEAREQRDRLADLLYECQLDLEPFDGDPKYPAKNSTLKRIRAALAAVKGGEE